MAEDASFRYRDRLSEGSTEPAGYIKDYIFPPKAINKPSKLGQFSAHHNWKNNKVPRPANVGMASCPAITAVFIRREGTAIWGRLRRKPDQP